MMKFLHVIRQLQTLHFLCAFAPLRDARKSSSVNGLSTLKKRNPAFGQGFREVKREGRQFFAIASLGEVGIVCVSRFNSFFSMMHWPLEQTDSVILTIEFSSVE